MKTERVYTRSATYQKFEVLKTNRNKRYKYGEFFVEGVRNINNAVENGWEIVSFLYDGDRKLSDWARDKLAAVRTQVNCAAICSRRSAARRTPRSCWRSSKCGTTIFRASRFRKTR